MNVSDGNYETGRSDGRAWGKDKATSEQLRRLKKFRSMSPGNGWLGLFSGHIPAWAYLAAEIMGEFPKTERKPVYLKFWENSDKECIKKIDYVTGFMDGALNKPHPRPSARKSYMPDDWDD